MPNADELDVQIRALVAQLVAVAPPAPELAQLEHQGLEGLHATGGRTNQGTARPRFGGINLAFGRSGWKPAVLLVAVCLAVVSFGLAVRPGQGPRGRHSADATTTIADRIDQLAFNAAYTSGDHTPASVSWVATTRQKASASLGIGALVISTQPSYLLEVRGHFSPKSIPGDTGSAQGTVLQEVVSADTFKMTDFEVSVLYLNLAHLGKVHTDSLRSLHYQPPGPTGTVAGVVHLIVLGGSAAAASDRHLRAEVAVGLNIEPVSCRTVSRPVSTSRLGCADVATMETSPGPHQTKVVRNGGVFQFQLPPGRYVVTANSDSGRGFWFTRVNVRANQTVKVVATIRSRRR